MDWGRAVCVGVVMWIVLGIFHQSVWMGLVCGLGGVVGTLVSTWLIQRLGNK